MFTQGPLSAAPMLIRHPILLKNTPHVMLLDATHYGRVFFMTKTLHKWTVGFVSLYGTGNGCLLRFNGNFGFYALDFYCLKSLLGVSGGLKTVEPCSKTKRCLNTS